MGVLGNRLGSNRIATRVETGDPCRPDPCGENTECTSRGNRAVRFASLDILVQLIHDSWTFGLQVCSCRLNHYGDPYTRCELDPCKQAQCGINAECHDQGRPRFTQPIVATL